MNRFAKYLALAVVVCLFCHFALATADFYTVPSIPVTNGVSSIATGDFNNDGLTDVVTVNFTTVSILLGLPGGGFRAPVTLSAENFPVFVGVADFNGDGRQDLAVVNKFGAAIELLEGKGNGNFQPARPVYFHSSEPAALAIGDFNGDGHPDVAVVSILSKDVNVLLGTGTGGFSPAVDYPLGQDKEYSIVSGDVNNDGKIDLVIGGGNTKVLRGNGDGTFQAVSSVPVAASNVLLADLNNDGKLDLITWALLGGSFEVALGNGDGTFQTATVYTVGVAGAPQSAVALDLNNDGKLDVVTVAQNNSLSVLFGKGDGTFPSPVLYDVGIQPYVIASGTFGRTHAFSLVVGDLFSALDVVSRNPDATLRAPHVTSTYNGGSATVLDANSDGKLDVVQPEGDGIDVQLGIGNGFFRPLVHYTTGVNLLFVAHADVNGDGKSDLVGTTLNGISVLLGNGDGTFGSPTNYNLSPVPGVLAIGDFNGDGKADIAGISHDQNMLSILLNNGDGSFGTARVTTTPPGPESLALADFNGDGKLDAAMEEYSNTTGTGQATVFLGKGNGTFGAGKNYAAIQGQYASVRAADFNNDGRPDIVLANVSDQGSESRSVSVMVNTGTGTFQTPVTWPVSNLPAVLEVGDFNLDGNQDIAIGGEDATPHINILDGNGDGTFQPDYALNVCSYYYNQILVAADFNSDGKPDMLDYCIGTLTVLPNSQGPR